MADSMASNSSPPSSSGMLPAFLILDEAALSSELVFLLLLETPCFSGSPGY